jgi:outer membrane protein
MKRNYYRGTSFLLLTLFCLIHPNCLQGQARATDHQLNGGTQEAPTLTLTDVIALVLQNNRSLISSAYGVESQAFSLDIAQSAFEWKLFPQVSAAATDESRLIGGGVTVEKKFVTGPIASMRPSIVRRFNEEEPQAYGAQLGLSLTVPLLRGFGSEVNLNGVRVAQYSSRTAKRSHYLVKVNTVLEAVAVVYDILQQREVVALYRSQANRFQSHAVMAEAREKIGLATPIDVYRAQIRLKDAQDGLNRAQEALRSAGDRLKIVIATPLEQAMQVAAPLVWQPLDISLVQAVETALQHRVELEQVDDYIEEIERTSRLSKNNLLPQVDLVANYTRLENDDVFFGATQLTEDYWSIDLVSTTDWSRTAEKATYQQSLLAVKRAKLDRSTRIDSIKREVRQFYDALQKAHGRMQIRDDQINQAMGKLALAKIKFGHGMANNFDVIEAESELQEARLNLLAAQIESIVGMYRLRAAIGTLIDS